MTLDPVFRPRSVAVIGASPREGALSGRFVSELLRHGYKGRVAPVNPRYSEVFELPCFPDIAGAAAEMPIDLAVIALPREMVLEVLEDCHQAGVAAALVFSSGFSEMGADGRQEEAKIRDLAKRTGLRLLGPNCAGYINIQDATCLMMSSISFRSHFFPGRVAVVAQSGGVAGIVCERAQDVGLGLSMALSTGNETDVTFGEILQWLAAEEETRVVAGYFEAVRDVGAFVAGLEALRAAGKPLVMLTAGGTGAAARATAAHTGGLATADDVLQAVFDRYDVIRVFGVDDLIDTAMCLADVDSVPGRRVGIVTTSGGVGTLAAEAAERAGLEVPAFEPGTRAALAERVPDFAGLENPLDMTAMFQEDLSIFSKSLRVLGAAPEIDVPLLCVATHSPAFADRLEGQLLEYKAECQASGAKLPIVLWVAGRMSANARERLRQHGLPVFEDPNRCMRAVNALAARQRSAAAGAPEPVLDGTLPAEIALAARSTEFEALQAFRAAGVPTVESIHCASAAEAADAAVALGERVVVKASAPDLLHKSDVGAVIVGVVGPEAGAAAHDRVVQAAEKAGVAPDGSIVQAMAPEGIEIIVGARRDPKFGPVLVVAPGGLGAELTTDVARRLLPLRRGEAEGMLRELRSFPLLAGYRSQPAADIPAAVAAIEGLARFVGAVGDRLQAAEINPLIVHRAGQGASAVDGLILLES